VLHRDVVAIIFTGNVPFLDGHLFWLDRFTNCSLTEERRVGTLFTGTNHSIESSKREQEVRYGLHPCLPNVLSPSFCHRTLSKRKELRGSEVDSFLLLSDVGVRLGVFC
jgi:hypothetical protein